MQKALKAREAEIAAIEQGEPGQDRIAFRRGVALQRRRILAVPI